MPPGIPSQPKTSGLAIWSLVLGILGLMCFSIFTAIPGVICGHKALNRIKNSFGAVSGNGLAIGGLITGYLAIVWAIVFIPLMMAIAIPNFVKARQISMQNACINNLRVVQSAKQEWALENQKPNDATPTENDLTPYLPNHQMPVCPAGGTYTIGNVTNSPTCSIPGHELPESNSN
jgi:competence protein ComGC